MEDSNNIIIGAKKAEGNAYDSALKQLIVILKSKASDNLKQLEELWDSINYSPSGTEASSNNKNGKTRTSPTPSSSSQSPVNIMSENSNDSSSSTSSNLKRDYSKTSTTNSSSRPIKRIKPSSESARPNPSIKSVQKSKKDNNIDMLDDFTCIVCKNFNQVINNKLIECRKCSSLYHQLCHVPKIRNDDVDFEECSSCKIDSSSEDNEIANINMKSVERSAVYSPDSLSNGSSKKDNEVNGHSELSTSPESGIKSAPSVKGLAGLATKFGAVQEKRAKTPTQPVEKTKNELFNLNKKKNTSATVSNGTTGNNKLKTSLPVNAKKSGLFNLSNGLNNQKTTFSSLKDKKSSSGSVNKLGEIQKSSPSISITRKIS